jgi:hypothetical protein
MSEMLHQSFCSQEEQRVALEMFVCKSLGPVTVLF